MRTNWELVVYKVGEDVRDHPSDPMRKQKAKTGYLERKRTVTGEEDYDPPIGTMQSSVTFYIGSHGRSTHAFLNKWYCKESAVTPSPKVGWWEEVEAWQAWGEWEDFTP